MINFQSPNDTFYMAHFEERQVIQDDVIAWLPTHQDFNKSAFYHQYLAKGGGSGYLIDMHITLMYVSAQLMFQFRQYLIVLRIGNQKIFCFEKSKVTWHLIILNSEN